MPSLLSELHSHRSRKPSRPHLPPKDLGIELVNDFFATINLLCPVLHRPSFYREVSRLSFCKPANPPADTMLRRSIVRPEQRFHCPVQHDNGHCGSRQTSCPISLSRSHSVSLYCCICHDQAKSLPVRYRLTSTLQDTPRSIL
jgi:hypothetical protein